MQKVQKGTQKVQRGSKKVQNGAKVEVFTQNSKIQSTDVIMPIFAVKIQMKSKKYKVGQLLV